MEIFFINNGIKIFLENLKNNKLDLYNNKYINLRELKKVLEEAKKQKINLYYIFDFLGILDNFKINKKSISCFDTINNKIYFKYNNNYKFYLEGFRIEK